MNIFFASRLGLHFLHLPFYLVIGLDFRFIHVKPALWLFVDVEGVEPTNNAAERAIRPAVIW